MAESAQRKVSGAVAKKNSVHRTTTETMRLDSATGGPTTTTLGAQAQCRKKTPSFQITSVTVGARTSHDAGEDSNDDLDESHTEDNSRLTDVDLETPSYSEDTFSKEDVFFNAGNAALSTAPVIPTSSQYGLAIVPNEAAGAANSNNDNNINALDIASVTENNIINLLAANAKQDTDLREVHSHGRNERFKVVKIESTEPFKRGRWTCMDYLDHTSVNQPTAISTPKVSNPNEVCISYGVTDSGIVIADSTKQTLLSDADKATTIGSVDSNGQISHQEMLNAQQLSSGGGATSAAGGGNSTSSGNTTTYVASSLPNAAPSSSAQQPQGYFPTAGSQAQAQAPTQGATLPANLAQGSMALLTGNSGALGKDEAYSPGMQSTELPGIQVIPSIHKVPQAAAPSAAAPPPLQSQVISGGAGGSQTAVQQMQPPQVSAGVIGTIPPPTQPQQQGSGVAFHQPDAEQDSVTAILVGNAPQSADAALLESLAEVTQQSDEQQALEDNESVSGTSAVAIDNKIEQAMDLVKSHLMFAVREEVEVLKEKIAELMDRINQLEAENALLKAHATPETLAQLSQVAAKLSLNNSGSGQ